MKYDFELNKIYTGDNIEILRTFPTSCIDLIVTSPNYNNWRNKRVQKRREDYWKRTNIIYDNFEDKETDELYEAKQIKIINEMIRVLKPTGTLCYNHKDRIHNFEVTSPLKWIMKSDAKYRQRITWDRGGMQAYNPVRFYRVDEDIYILGKESKGFTWNPNFAKYLSIWKIAPNKNIYGHPATFPEEIVKRCIESFTNDGDIVLDPYSGTGTTAYVAKKMKRLYIGIDVSKKYNEIAIERLNNTDTGTLEAFL